MTAEPVAETTSKKKAAKGGEIIFFGLLMIVVSFLLFDLAGLTHGGGIFSLFSAVEAAELKARTVDIDDSALVTPMVIAISLVVIGICRKLAVKLETRGPQFLFAAAIIGSALVMHGIFGESMISYLMSTHGYIRCEARDHTVGSGKSRVRFHTYVMGPQHCV